MTTRRSFIALASAAAVAALFPSAAMSLSIVQADASITTVAQYTGGSFERIDGSTWQEFKAGSNRPFTTFRETHSDEWSIYLQDDSRNVQIQLDMHRNVIGYGEDGGAKRDLYEMTSSDRRINGRSATYVGFDGGAFSKNGGIWEELGEDGGVRYTFRETGRDMWSIYARDDSRNMDMQMDLHRNKIRLAWPGHSMQDQYTIITSYY